MNKLYNRVYDYVYANEACTEDSKQIVTVTGY